VKQCPTCKRSYADDTLRFCLEDGTELNIVAAGEDPHRTEKFPATVTQAAHNAVRIDIPPSGSKSQGPTAQPVKSRPIVLIILVAIAALAVIVVVGAAGLLGVFYYYSTGDTTTVDSKTPSPVPSASPATSPYEIVLNPNDQSEKLEDKLKELQKKIEDAANSNSDTELPWDPGDLPNLGRTAKVNSPNDGFLALRNLPSQDIGDRIAKIPHGATINVLLCSEQSVTIAGRTGHWCMVSHNSQTGWVFDVWLEFQKS
jgi:hypothetical protein